MANPHRRILRVGLTGNIAAGKSTVAAWMGELGCFVIDLDHVGHDCLAVGRPSHARVVEAFGAAVQTGSGDIDREALATVVFADAAARKRLESILHPVIRDEEEHQIAAWAAGVESGIAVSEAALLYESGGADRYDRMVVVAAAEETRLARLLERGADADDARRRMAAQMDQDEKIRRADYVIDNNGALAATRIATEAMVTSLRNELEHAAT